MKSFNKIFLIVIFLFFGVFTLAQEFTPQPPQNITYPVVELGNCQNEQECKLYCEDPGNAWDCLDFAEEHNIFSIEEINRMKRLLTALANGEGPGGCTNEQECSAFCDDMTNMEECMIFAKKHNIVSQRELEEMEKVLRALNQGIEPPDCSNKSDCDQFCSQPENIEQCIEFAVAAGFMDAEEAEMVRKTGGKGPGNCHGKEECDAFCEDPNNMEECILFSIEYGLSPPEDEENMRMSLEAIRKGINPPPCKSEQECDEYCALPDNIDHCLEFAIAAGFMTPEDAEMMRKTGGKGPGNCHGKEECESFCDNPANEDACFEFALEHDLIPEEDLQKMREGIDTMRRELNSISEEARKCVYGRLDKSILDGINDGTLRMRRDTGDIFWNVFHECREEFEFNKEMQKQMEGGEFQKWPYEEGMGPEGGGMMQSMPGEMEEMQQQYMEKETQEVFKEVIEQFKQLIPLPQEEVIGEPIKESIKEEEETKEACQQNGANRVCGSEIGTCQIGVQICQNGFWGDCLGDKEPTQEICDDVDNDCDGQTDEDNVCSQGQSNNFLASIISFFKPLLGF